MWSQLPPEHRPVPHLKVVAGHAGKDKAPQVNQSLLTAFELAHGIPPSTLKITRHDCGNPEGVVVAEGREWQPSTYTGHSSASAQTLAAQAHIGNNNTSAATAYEVWSQLPSEHRPVPHGKVVAGHAGKDEAQRVTDPLLTAFELAHGIPPSTLKITRDDQRESRGCRGG